MFTLAAICLVLCLAGCGGPSRPSSFGPHVQQGRPSFLTRVHDDCLAGNQWACDMLNSLSNAMRDREER